MKKKVFDQIRSMAFRKMLPGSSLDLAKHSSTGAALQPPPPHLRRLLPGSAGSGVINCRILLQQRSIFQSGAAVPSPSIRIPLPIGENLMKRIRSSMMRDQIQIDAFAPPPSPFPPARSETDLKEDEERRSRMVISVADARKLLKATRIEAVRARLRAILRSYVGYSEFAEICREAAAGSDECAREIAAALDHSGVVVVLGDVVFLRPAQVARAIESAISSQPILSGTNDPRTSELKEMEAKKAAIDNKAEAQVKKELWAGLGLMVLQTVGFMRLTFWELSWDVMEPICFFTTSIYFMLGYAFFLRTAKEPSFEGLFASRFAVKQRRLMKSHSFDLSKLKELRRVVSSGSSPHLPSCECHCHRQAEN